MTKPLAGKVAVVTGAANGIGRATVERFAREGAHVALLDRDEHALKSVAAELKRTSDVSILPILIDLLDRPAIAGAFAQTRRELGPIDILVSNAGQSARERQSEFYAAADEVLDFVIDLNLKATLLCTREVVGEMRARRSGKIICMSSEAAFNGIGKVADYAAAKAGIIGFVRSLATEMAPFNVNVNAVCPGLTRTTGFDKSLPEVRDKVQANLPWGRLAEPHEVASVVHFLASDDASYVSGHAIVVSGAHSFS